MTDAPDDAALPGASDVPEPGQVTAVPTRRQRILDWARHILVTAVVVAAVLAVVNQWPEVQLTLQRIAWWQVGLSLVTLIVGILLGMLSWRAVVVGIAHPGPGKKISQVYLIGQMGKYVPGSVWAFLLQMEVGRKNGIARAQVFVAALVSTGVTVAASLVVGLVALPYLTQDHPQLGWLYLLLPAAAVALHPKVITFLVNLVLRIVRRPPLDQPLRLATIAQSFGFAVVMYGVYGVHLWILVRSAGGIGFGNALFATGALALGMTTGLFAFLLPSGIGAREAVIVAALSTFLPTGSALAFALLSRVMFTVGELIAMGASYLDLRSSRRSADPAGPARAPDGVSSA